MFSSTPYMLVLHYHRLCRCSQEACSGAPHYVIAAVPMTPKHGIGRLKTWRTGNTGSATNSSNTAVFSRRRQIHGRMTSAAKTIPRLCRHSLWSAPNHRSRQIKQNICLSLLPAVRVANPCRGCAGASRDASLDASEIPKTNIFVTCNVEIRLLS
jgi:hypothetical protein